MYILLALKSVSLYAGMTEMSAVEKLRPFLAFGQSIGFIPYLIEPGNTKQIIFYWFHPITFLFALSFILQMFPVITGAWIFQFFSSTNSSFLLTFLVLATNTFNFFMILIGRWAVLNYKLLRSATKSITHNVIKTLEKIESISPNCQNGIRKRTFIGIICVLIMVYKHII